MNISSPTIGIYICTQFHSHSQYCSYDISPKSKSTSCFRYIRANRFLILIRTSRYWFSPLGLKLGIKASKVKKLDDNVILEKEFLKDSTLKHKEIVGLAKRLDWTERQVLRWFRIRKMQGKPTTLVKFCENRYCLLASTCNWNFVICNHEIFIIIHCTNPSFAQSP